MKKKLLSLISAVLCLCMVLSACGGPANNDPSSSISESQGGDNTQDKTLTIATMTETTTLSPLYMGVYNYSMCTMLYETLLKYEDGEVKGNLAESYSFNEDGTVMTLTLRQGITFHDGTPFNAEAVKKNLDFMHSNPQYMACPGIYDIESVEATDEYTVTITYPHPYYGYAYDFCWPDVGGMQSPNQIVEGDFQTVQGYAGTGPYIYEEYVSGEYTRFVRNENYWGEEPYFDEIIARYIPDSTSRLQALQTGEIDLVYGSSMISYQDYQQATALDGVAGAIAEKDTRARDITLNASSGPLVDARVRQAVSHAINKEEFSDGLDPRFHNRQLVGDFHGDHPGPARRIFQSEPELFDLQVQIPSVLRLTKILQRVKPSYLVKFRDYRHGFIHGFFVVCIHCVNSSLIINRGYLCFFLHLHPDSTDFFQIFLLCDSESLQIFANPLTEQSVALPGVIFMDCHKEHPFLTH